MIIGVTGSFGSGKTTVAEMFARYGAYVIDADEVCHALMSPKTKVYKNIVRHFGKSILTKSRKIDRKKLGDIVFKNKASMQLLNTLVHPETIKEIEKIVRSKKNIKLIIVDAPLLVESGFYKKMDRLVVLKTSMAKQTRRLARLKQLTKKDILRRIRMQAPLKKKLALADFIIDNSGTRTQTLFQVRKIWKQIGVDYANKRKARH